MKGMKHVKSLAKRSGLKQRGALALALLALLPSPLFANPDGPQVVNGQASFSTTGNTLTVVNTPNTIVNWNNFSINPGEITRFVQGSETSAILNRVIGGNASAIYGTLQSNGKVFLVNQNGILFGPGATVNVASLVASTLAIRDEDFLAGRLNFAAGAVAGGIRNRGEITTPTGGSIYLIAPDVENSGLLNTPEGEIMLAAGHSVHLVDSAYPDVAHVVSAPADQALNLGQLIAQAGRIGIYGGIVAQKGMVSANSAVVDKSGRIFFKAQKELTLAEGSATTANGEVGGSVTVAASEGTTLLAGTIEAKASAGKGGEVRLLGEQVGLVEQGRVDVSGASGGGRVLVGGDYQGRNPEIQNARSVFMGRDASITADALAQGDGGQVILWSDDATRAYGAITGRGGREGGNGGFLETSSARYLDARLLPDFSAAWGQAGSWLLDPNDISIQAAGPDTNVTGTPNFTTTNDNAIITTATIQGVLDGGTDVTIATSALGANSQLGNITVADPLTWATAKNLTLTASNNITISAAITGSAGTLTLNAAGGVGGTAEIVTSKLELLGAALFNLNHASNNVGTLAANVSNVGHLQFTNGGALLTVGSVNSTDGITNGGRISLSATGGGITVAKNITAPDTVNDIINLSAAGNIATQSGADISGGLVLFYTVAGGNINLQGNVSANLAGQVAGGTILEASVGTAHLLTVGGSLTATSGQIDLTTQGGAITIAGPVSQLAPVGVINIDGGAGTISSSGAGLVKANNIDLHYYATGSPTIGPLATSAIDPNGAATTFRLGNINGTTGNLNIDHTGAATISSLSLTVGNSMAFAASKDLTVVPAIAAGAGSLVLRSNGGTFHATAALSGAGIDLFANSGFDLPVSLTATANLYLEQASNTLTLPMQAFTAPNLRLKADVIDFTNILTDGVLGGGAGSAVNILARTAGRPISLGAGNPATELVIPAAFFLNVPTETIRIGNTSSGAIYVGGPIVVTPTNLALGSGGDITQHVTGTIDVTKLAVSSFGDVLLDSAANLVQNVAAELGNSDNQNFNFSLKNGAINLNVGDVDGLSGISIYNDLANFNPLVPNAVIALLSSGQLTQSAGAVLAGKAVYAEGAKVVLTEANDTGVIAGWATGSLATDFFAYKSINPVHLSQVYGFYGIESGNVNMATSDYAVKLEGPAISQDADALLLAYYDALVELKTDGAVTLTAAGNEVSSFRLPIPIVSANFSLTSVNNLLLDTGIGGGSGVFTLTAPNIALDSTPGAMTVDAGTVNLTATAALGGITLSGANPVTITAANFVGLRADGSISLGAHDLTGTGQGVKIGEYTAGRSISLGTPTVGPCFDVANSCLVVTSGAFDNLHGPILAIGGPSSGDLYFEIASAPVNVTTLSLWSDGGITQTATGTIATTNLAVRAMEDVKLDTAANMVQNVAAVVGDGTHLNRNFSLKNGATSLDVEAGIDGLNGISMALNGVYDPQAPDGVISLISGLLLSQNGATAVLAGKAVYAEGALVSLIGNNPTGVVAGKATGAGVNDYFAYTSSSSIRLSTVNGFAGVLNNNPNIVPPDYWIKLEGPSIFQDSDAPLVAYSAANVVQLVTGGTVALNAAGNAVREIKVPNVTGDFGFTSLYNLVVASNFSAGSYDIGLVAPNISLVAVAVPVTLSGSDIKLQATAAAGTITLNGSTGSPAITAANGVDLEADGGINLGSYAVTGTAVGVHLGGYSSAQPISVGVPAIGPCYLAAAGDCLVINSGNLANITAPVLAIGGDGNFFLSAGNVYLESAINRGAGTLALLSGTSVIEETGITVAVPTLVFSTGGSFLLNRNGNMIATLAGQTFAGGDININNGQTFDIDLVSGTHSDATPFSFSGLNAGSANVILYTTSGAINGVTGGDDVIANTLYAEATAGITLQTKVSSLVDIVNLTTGHILLSNNNGAPGALTASNLSNSSAGGMVSLENYGPTTISGTGVSANGIISIVAHSPLTINGTISSVGGNVILMAEGTGAPGETGDTLTLNSPVQSNGGDIILTAGNAIIENSTVTPGSGKAVVRLANQNPPPNCGTGMEWDGSSCVAIVCPTGQQLVGNACEAIVCPTGQQLVGNTCEAIICPSGEQLVGNLCEAIVCPSGEQLVGSLCEAIVCPSGEQLVGSLCEAIVCKSGEQLVGSLCEAIVCKSGEQLVGSLCEPITCLPGQELVGGTCQTITCLPGQELVAGVCQAIECPYGQELVGNFCQDIPCGSNQIRIGGICLDLAAPPAADVPPEVKEIYEQVQEQVQTVVEEAGKEVTKNTTQPQIVLTFKTEGEKSQPSSEPPPPPATGGDNKEPETKKDEPVGGNGQPPANSQPSQEEEEKKKKESTEKTTSEKHEEIKKDGKKCGK